MSTLIEKSCRDYPRGTPALSSEQQLSLGKEIPDWINLSGEKIQREYKFKSYLQGVAWVEHAAQIAENDNHHPEITVLYRKIIVSLWTHTVKGLSENDYILAAKLDASYQSFKNSCEAS